MDRVLYLRPDVQLQGVSPSVVAHAAVLNVTNAVLVEASATSLRQADVRVGQGRDVNVTIGTETTVAGAGHSVTVRAGDAVGAGPSAGGDITIQPGIGIGGGTNGLFVPYATAVVNLGSDPRVWGTTFTRNLRPDTGQNLDVRTIQTGAGAGPNITLLTAAAGGAGPANGGDLILRTGAGAGAGTRGVIRFDDGGAAMSVLPTTSNLVTYGSTTLAAAAFYTRIVQADTTQSLLIRRQDGATWATTHSATGATQLSLTTQVNDAIQLSFGSSGDAIMVWSTAQTNDALVVGVGTNSAAQGGAVLLVDVTQIGFNFAHTVQANPTLFIHSAAASTTQWTSITHNSTNGVIETGTGVLHLIGATGNVLVTNNIAPIGVATGTSGLSSNPWSNTWTRQIQSDTSLTTTIAGGSVYLLQDNAGNEGFRLDLGTTGSTVHWRTVQRASTAGTPTGLLWTAGLHTGLTSAEFHDWNLNFANGGVAQLTQNAVAIALMRTFRIQPRTYSATAATQVITDAATVAIDGPPVAGVNVTITTAWAIRVATGSIGYGDGTAARPGLGPTSDPNTGLFAQAADAIGFSTGGTERMRLDTEAGADNTALWISRVGALQRVTLDVPDSGGVGFRALRVPN